MLALCVGNGSISTLLNVLPEGRIDRLDDNSNFTSRSSGQTTKGHDRSEKRSFEFTHFFLQLTEPDRSSKRGKALPFPSSSSAAIAQLVDPNGDQNDKADDDLLSEGGNAIHVQTVAQNADDERTNKGSGDRAYPAD